MTRDKVAAGIVLAHDAPMAAEQLNSLQDAAVPGLFLVACTQS